MRWLKSIQIKNNGICNCSGRVLLYILAIFLPLTNLKSIPNIILSAIIHQGYQWFLLKSYSIGDFTKVYPIFRWFGPLIVAIISILFLGITFNLTILLSIILISFGIMFLGFNFNSNINDTITLKYLLTIGLFISLYSLIYMKYFKLIINFY